MPRNTTSQVFFYVYVLESLLDGDRYTGYTSNLKRRLEEHKSGKSFATRFRRPFRLIYFEGCTHSEDAKRRERYLKTFAGRKIFRFMISRVQTHKGVWLGKLICGDARITRSPNRGLRAQSET